MAEIPRFDFITNPEKTLKPFTVRNYKNQLNKITKLSHLANEKDSSHPVILNKDHLLEHSNYVVSLIQENITNKQMLCVTYSAIFYALGRQDFTKDNRAEIFTLEFRKSYYTEQYKEKLKQEGKL
jgi:hypothetical protein